MCYSKTFNFLNNFNVIDFPLELFPMRHRIHMANRKPLVTAN